MLHIVEISRPHRSSGNFSHRSGYSARSMSRSIISTLVLSIAGHALFLGFGAPRQQPVVPFATSGISSLMSTATETFVRKTKTRAARRTLIAEARAARAKGTLQLGHFLLESERIDADEEGQFFDYDEALVRYEKRLTDLESALLDERFVVQAAASAFGDLRYHGRPGGRMGDALVDIGGSCEQIAQLVVASAYDVGRRKEVSFRAYGKPGPDGASHLAPISKYEGVDYDLMSGLPAAPGGAKVAPDELIEIYARVHGLAPPLERLAAKSGGAMEGKAGFGAAPAEDAPAGNLEPGRRSLASGFPPNDDAYPGSLPLYAERAVKSPATANINEGGLDEPEMAAERARHCAYFLRMSSLSPLTIDVLSEKPQNDDSNAVEAVRVPNGSRLEREARLLRAAEDLAANRSVGDADHLLSYACLTALGDVAAVDFSLAGERRLASLALETGKRAREGGKELLGGIRWKTPDGVALAQKLRSDYAGRFWLLLFLEGGEDVVLDLARHGDADDWGRISSAAALLLFPNTRIRAFQIVGKFSRREQVDVMHEIFHAHDHLRPWATNYEFEVPPDAPPPALAFAHTYRVFRALAFRLWEGQRDPGETVDAFLNEAREAGLDAAWQAALIDYYARNVLGLYSQRNKGFEIMIALDRAIQQNPHPSLDTLRRQIAYIKGEGRLDARTLADAFRQQ